MTTAFFDSIGLNDKWRSQAACGDKEELFAKADKFMHSPGTRGRKWVDEARSVCSECPVKSQCLASALSEEGIDAPKVRYSVRGGLTGAERREMYDSMEQMPSRWVEGVVA